MKRNAKRAKAAFLRAYGSAERVEWIRQRPSVVSGRTPCVNAHTRTGGMGRKADADTIVPLTAAEHDELGDCLGRAGFEAKYRVDLDALAAETERAWQEAVRLGRVGYAF